MSLNNFYIEISTTRRSAFNKLSVTMFFVCLVILQDQVIEWSCDLKGGCPSLQVGTLPSLMAMSFVVIEI